MHYASDFTRTIPVGGKFSTKQKEIYDIVLATNNRALEIAKPGITYQSVHLEASRVIAQGLKDLGIMKGNVEEAVRNGAHALFLPHGLGHMSTKVHLHYRCKPPNGILLKACFYNKSRFCQIILCSNLLHLTIGKPRVQYANCSWIATVKFFRKGIYLKYFNCFHRPKDCGYSDRLNYSFYWS